MQPSALVLHVEADTHESLVATACKVLGIGFITQPVATPAPVSTADVAPSPASAPATLPAPAPHTPRRKRADPTPSPAAPDVVTTSAPSPAPAAPVAAVSPVPTIDDLRAALRVYCDANGGGETSGVALLAKYGFGRVSLVTEDKRAEIIKACHAPVAAAPAAGAVPTVDDVRTALMSLNDLLGMAVCTALLTEVGVNRYQDVPEDKRAAFIAACTKKLNKPAPGA